MKSISELTDFYYKSLYPKLQELEKERKNVRYRIFMVSGFLILLAIIIAALFSDAMTNSNLPIFLLFALFALITFVSRFIAKDYRENFKHNIIKELIHAIDNSLHYNKESYVREHHFVLSDLFGKPDRINGNDHVSGKIDGISLEFSDLHAEKKHKDSKGRTSWSTLFQGLFIISEFPKNFQGKTLIFPDTAQKTFGDFIGQWLQSKNVTKDALVKMDDPEFEKEFVVYSNDQIEARYILSHSLMQRLVEFQKKSEQPLYVSFHQNKIFLAINYGKDLFEPTIFSTLLDYKLAMEYIKTLNMTIGIVEELKLNQKLWSKK